MAKLKLDDEALLTEIKDQFKAAKQHLSEWRTEAAESFDFVAGRQWSEEDKADLEEQERPVITFNRMGPYFDAIAGYEINNRQEIKFRPRTVDDTKQTEILNAATKWVLDQTNAQDEESDAFVDTLIGGYGWIETYMDYETDPEGKICMRRVDPLEMYYDPWARQKNLTDRRSNQHVQWKTKAEIKERWPDATLGLSADPWEDDTKTEPHNASLAFLYKTNATGFDEKSGRYRVVRHQYYETETQYKVIDPATNQAVILDAKKFKIAQDAYPDLVSAKQKKRVYKEAYVIGDEIVERSDLKCQGFTYQCITGKRDRNKNIFYGLARVMKDPQRWANKFFSQILHIINANAKGGLMAEEGAFVDPKKAEETWADPSAVVMLKNGALAGNKVKERVAASYPQGLDKMLQFAISSIPDVTGVNPEFIGAVDRQQAGILEQERKKSAFTILAGFFDSMRLYRKEQGRLLMHYIKAYLNDGRIIRITTPQGEMPIPLRLSDDTMSYDVVVDQAPDSPNLKEEVWNTLGQLVPQFLKAGIALPPDILKFSPLPSDMAQKFAEGMEGKLPPKAQEAMQKMQEELQMLQKQNFELKQAATDKANAIASKHELGKEQNQILAAQIEQTATKHAQDSSQKEVQSHRDMFLSMQQLAQQQAADNKKAIEDFDRHMRDSLRELEIAHLNASVTHHANEAKSAEKKAVYAEKQAKSDAPAQAAKMTKTLQDLATKVAAVSKEVTVLKEEEMKPKEPKKRTAKITRIRDKNGNMVGATLVDSEGNTVTMEVN